MMPVAMPLAVAAVPLLPHLCPAGPRCCLVQSTPELADWLTRRLPSPTSAQQGTAAAT